MRLAHTLLAVVGAAACPDNPMALRFGRSLTQAPNPVVHGGGCVLANQVRRSATGNSREHRRAFDHASDLIPALRRILHLNKPLVDELKLTQIGQSRATDPSGRNVLTLGLYAIQGLKLGNSASIRWVRERRHAIAQPLRQSRRDHRPHGFPGLHRHHRLSRAAAADHQGEPAGARRDVELPLRGPDSASSAEYRRPFARSPHRQRNSRYALIVPERFAAGLPNYGDRFPIGTAHTVNNKYRSRRLADPRCQDRQVPALCGHGRFSGSVGDRKRRLPNPARHDRPDRPGKFDHQLRAGEAWP